ncbi:unnamed protein product [Adineta steineri]|uniref:F-box domain-containing protein n=1 Tax=Adineta steineri TaxID=433720 RepID=A0A813ZER3_9BILA|nr:unnamed protein product [Adineta steineri]
MTNASLLTLPTELVYYILNNLDTCFIIFSFRLVCKRFQAISEVYDQYELDLDSISEDCLKRIACIIQPEKIISLTVQNAWNQPSRIKEFFSIFEISRLTRLRSITLGNLDNGQDKSLLNHLTISNLVSFDICILEIHERDTLDFISKVVTQPTLNQLNSMKSQLDHSIVHLTMKSCSLKEYHLILQRLPRLRSIITGQLIMKKSDEPITSYSATIRYPQLMSLVIGDSSLSITDFEEVLSLTPSLGTLKLISYRKNLDSLLDGSVWTQLIQTKLPNLKIFQFFFSYTLERGHDAKDLDLIVNQFRTPFWLHENKWIIICDYFFQEKVIHFYTTPMCTIDFKQQLKSTKMPQLYSRILRFNSSSMDSDFQPIVHLMYAAYNVTKPKTIQRIYLEDNAIGKDGALHIAEWIKSNKVLTAISLGNNQIGSRGAKYISDALQDNMVICHIFLEENGIGDKGAQFLAKALRNKTTLASLQLANNQIGAKGAQYLSNILQNNVVTFNHFYHIREVNGSMLT